MKINLLHIRNFIIIVIVFISCIVSGCRETTTEIINNDEEYYLFVEAFILTDGRTENHGYIDRFGDNYIYDVNKKLLYAGGMEYSNGKKFNAYTRFILGVKTNLSRNLGGGILSGFKESSELLLKDSVTHTPFPGSYEFEIVSAQKNGDILIKLNDKLILLKNNESVFDSLLIGDCVVYNKYRYSNIVHYLTISNHGYIPKKNVKYGWE